MYKGWLRMNIFIEKILCSNLSKNFRKTGAKNNIEMVTITKAMNQVLSQTLIKSGVKPKLTATSTKLTKKVVIELINKANFKFFIDLPIQKYFNNINEQDQYTDCPTYFNFYYFFPTQKELLLCSK
jgi:hypothetical protein